MINKNAKDNKNNNQVSNNFLVVLILATILFSTIGTWISLSRLGPLTGLALSPGTGQVNVTVNATLSFTLAPESVNFTSMNPGDSNDTTDFAPPPFNVTNTGTVLINISVKTSASLFLNASENSSSFTGCCGNTTGSLDGVCASNYISTPTDNKSTNCNNFFNISTTNIRWSAFHDYADTNDTRLFHLNVTVPASEPVGARLVTLTFTASQAS